MEEAKWPGISIQNERLASLWADKGNALATESKSGELGICEDGRPE